MYNKDLYSRVYNLYELKNANGVLKENIRKYLTRRMKRELQYKNKKWHELSETEKSFFTHVIIKDDMLWNYCTDIYPRKKIKEIEAKIVDETKNSVLVGMSEIKVKNAIDLEKKHYIIGDSEQNHRKQYEEFKNDLKMFFEDIPIPSFEDWKKDNQEFPMRIKDYYLSYVNQPPIVIDEAVSQKKVDHIIIMTILKVLEKELGITIDVNEIINCLQAVTRREIEDLPVLDENDLDDAKYAEAQKKMRNYSFFETNKIIENIIECQKKLDDRIKILENP